MIPNTYLFVVKCTPLDSGLALSPTARVALHLTMCEYKSAPEVIASKVNNPLGDNWGYLQDPYSR